MSSLSSTGCASLKADESSTMDKDEDVGDTGTDVDSDYDPDKEELPDKLILSSSAVPLLPSIPTNINNKANLSKLAEGNRNVLNVAADCKPTLNVPSANISNSPLKQTVQNVNFKVLPDASKPPGIQFTSQLLNTPLPQLMNLSGTRYVGMPRTQFINMAGAQPIILTENHVNATQMVNVPGIHMVNAARNMFVNIAPRTQLLNAPRPQLPNSQPQLPQLVRMSGAQFANLQCGPRYIVTPNAHLSQNIRTQLNNLPGNRFNNPTGVQLMSSNTTRPQFHNSVGISYNNTPRFQFNNPTHFQATNIVEAQFNNFIRTQLPNAAGVQFNNTVMSSKQSTKKMKECLTRLVRTSTGTQIRAESNLSSFTPAQLQELFVANPNFLTQGIPNEMLSPSCSKVQQPTPSSTQISNNNKPSTGSTTRFMPVNGLQVGALQIPQTPDEDVDYEEIGVAETYATYKPSKLRMGCRHPDPVVETASLSSVDPIEPVYKLSLPNSVIMAGKLSSLQLEAIVYANQAHECRLPDGSRAGFFLGDGAGVGKGRTIAGIIYENFLKGRKRALWISVSNDLKYDAERDLRDIGAEFISVHSLNKFKYTKITTQDQQCRRGVIFCTYAALIGESNNTTGHYRSRFKQLLQWCGRDFDGVIVFDECHKAKNLSLINASKSTKTGTTVLELQQKLPYARIVYASATGASEPRNMAYMVRLGLCGEGTAFASFTEFLNAVELRGVGAMEIVAMDMKLRGMYIARQLSFKDVSFHIEEVPLSVEFRKIYNRSVDLWVDAMSKFTLASKLVGTDKRTYKVIWCQFWCAHQRFFKYLCIASKVNYAVKTARAAIKNGKCVVIGLQSTGESRTLDQLERDDGELNDFVSTAKNIFLAFVEKHFPAPERERYNHLRMTGDVLTSMESNVSGAQGTERGNAKSTRVAKRQRMGELYSDLGFYYDYDSDLVDSDDDQDEDEVEDDNNEGDGEVDDDDFGTPSLADTDSDDDDDSTLSPIHEFLAKSEAALKRPRGRPRKSNKVLKAEKLTVQDRVLELIQRKLGYARKVYVCQTDENGMPIHSTPNEVKAKEQFEKEVETAIRLRESLIRSIERLGQQLPPNTLDHLIDELGGPDNVAEMTGRRGRVVQTNSGIIRYETRCEQDTPMETINIIEKQRFMNGEKDVAVISEAASSGISLQSDRRCKNQRRRVHITMELPWSADRAVQQFGRTHRSNQVNAPEYIFLISDLAGERRFASTVAKRLESLGALTHGDRRATDTRDLSQFNIDNKYGRAALEAIMKAIAGDVSPIVPPPKDYKGANFFRDCAEALAGVGMLLHSEDFPELYTLDKDYNNISKFLNRILGCHVDLQNALFKYFNDTMNYIINQMKRTGKFDLGILDLGAHGEHVTPVGLVRFIRKHATGLAPTELHTLVVARGMTWYDVVNKYATLSKNYEGFYLTKHERDGKRGIVLAVEEEPTTKPTSQMFLPNADKTKEEIMLRVYRPNTGAQVRSESLHDIEERYTRCTSTEAKPYWLVQYTSSSDSCTHVYWTGQCPLSHECQVGLRDRVYHVLSGSVLPIWTRVERILTTHITNAKMQVIRLKTTSGRKIVGTMIPKQCFDTLIQNLREDSEKVEEYKY